MYDDDYKDITEIHGEDELTEEAITEAYSSAVNDSVSEGIKETVEIVLEEEGYPPSSELINEGHRLLTEKATSNHKDTPSDTASKDKHGSENQKVKTIKDNTPPQREEDISESWLKKEPSKREKMIAVKEGLEEFISNEYSRLEQKEFNKDIPSQFNEKAHILQKIAMAEEKINELQKQSNNEPQDQEINWDEVPDWKTDIVAHEDRSRRSKLSTIKSIAAEGLEMNGKWGMEAMGELSKENDSLITQAKIASELSGSKHPASISNNKYTDLEYDDNPSEDEEFEEENEIKPYG